MRKFLLVLAATVCGVFGADSFKFTEKVTDKIVTFDGFPDVDRTISGTINATLTVPGLRDLVIDDMTVWGMMIGALQLGGMVGEADVRTANSVTFIQTDMFTDREVGRITFSRSGDRLTITGKSSDLGLGIVSGLLPPEVGTETGALPVDLMVADLLVHKDIFYKATTTITHKTQSGMEFDLFSINVTGEMDVTMPTVAITAPKANERITNPLIKGKAGDNVGVSHVIYYINGVLSGEADVVGGLWEFEAPLEPSTTPYTIGVRSVDLAGNYSSQVNVKFVVVISAPIHLEVDNGGSVKGATDGQLLEVGKKYTLTATASPGYIFLGWSGDTNVTAVTLNFVMRSPEFSIRANFAPATFTGLFMPSAPAGGGEPPEITVGNSGFFTLTRTTKGVASGKILMQGKTHSFSGKNINATGPTVFDVNRAGQTPLRVQFEIENEDGQIYIHGSITDVPATFTSTVFADGSVNAENRWGGKYTITISAFEPPTEEDEILHPEGAGPNVITVTKQNASLVGTLGDGTPINGSAPLLAGGEDFTVMPLYVPLQGGKGIVIGWVFISVDEPEDGPAGTYVYAFGVRWIKAPAPKEKRYPAGFSVDAGLNGAKYTPRPATGHALDWTSGFLDMYGGNLPFFPDGEGDTTDSIFKIATLNKTKFTFTDLPDEPTGTPKVATLKPNLTINSATGAVTGDFKNPAAGGAVTKFVGTIIQDAFGQYIEGYFIGKRSSAATANEKSGYFEVFEANDGM